MATDASRGGATMRPDAGPHPGSPPAEPRTGQQAEETRARCPEPKPCLASSPIQNAPSLLRFGSASQFRAEARRQRPANRAAAGSADGLDRAFCPAMDELLDVR